MDTIQRAGNFQPGEKFFQKGERAPGSLSEAREPCMVWSK